MRLAALKPFCPALKTIMWNWLPFILILPFAPGFVITYGYRSDQDAKQHKTLVEIANH